MIKLIGLDIDGTLLRSDKSLSQRNKDALHRAMKAGVTVTIATGRAYMATTKVMEMAEIPAGPAIVFGGAQVVSYPAGEILYEDPIPEPLAREMIAYAQNKGVYIQCYDSTGYYMEHYSALSDLYAGRCGIMGRETHLLTHPFGPIPKLLCIVERAEDLPGFMEEAQEHFKGRLAFTRSWSDFAEAYRPGVNKGTALRALAEQMGLKKEEVLSIGDDMIDLPMIQEAGIGCAVANALDKVKQAADYVSPYTNDEDAVARMIDKFVFGREE